MNTIKCSTVCPFLGANLTIRVVTVNRRGEMFTMCPHRLGVRPMGTPPGYIVFVEDPAEKANKRKKK